MKVLKNIWKGIRFGIGMIFTVPFLISMFCTYLFGIAVAVFDYSIIDKISEKLSIVKNNNTELTDDEKEKESKQESDKCDSNRLR